MPIEDTRFWLAMSHTETWENAKGDEMVISEFVVGLVGQGTGAALGLICQVKYADLGLDLLGSALHRLD